MSMALDGLGYQDTTPLGFRPQPAPPEGAFLAGLNAETLEVLVADSSLDERSGHGEKKYDEEHALSEDIQRLEFKVNVLIQLVARLLKREELMPPERAWRLHVGGLEWLAGAQPESGVGIVDLYASRVFPEPLRLPGRVLGVREDASGRWVQFAFDGLSPQVSDLLAKLIFRHHRRAVAGTRAQPKS